MSQEKLPYIVYSCYFNASRGGEHFIADHIFSYQISGSIVTNDGQREYVFAEGDFRFSRRNQLTKYVKIPPPNGSFKTVAIFFDQQTLREFSDTFGYTASKKEPTPGLIKLPASKLYKNFIDSLLPYLESEQLHDQELFKLKVKEALHILLKVNPELKNILFDFTEPGKIDLEGFMQKNFHFKVGLNRFAYLTGRSLATFKRDFEKIFNTSPSRWLTRRRLQEAYYLIKEQGKRPSEVYFDLGFEDFSHFSYAFRQAYGAAPTKI
ncbi:helix-turn-helix transcriptional regulator [Mucilaginibacter sp. HC2]|uniref:helix-turn-helix domain-containing protein n=1 Tax=Mucilaginibacter inviolabilis TaxID=2714892 RepID=UPI00140BFDE7|nr:AraC family transcriptional regulator [Mucilaginibacter inviolabilis]NHA04386.1 helix-turn-helix transcriptional regulator [Mucilaginibacter inviolabilis]